MNSNSVLSLFDDRVKFALTVYDDRRGKSEDNQQEKLLCFYPAHAAVGTQVAVVGLAQALTNFAGTFSQVASKSWFGKGNPGRLEALLANAYALFVLLHGTVGNLLQQDGSAHSAKLRLQCFMQDLAGHVVRPEGRSRLGSVGPLIMLPACPILPVAGRAFLGVQSLVNNLFATSIHGNQAVHGVLVALDNQLLWSSAQRGDTLPLYQLAVNALMPAVTPLTLHIARRKEQGHPSPIDSEEGPGPDPPLVCSTRWLQHPNGLLAVDTPGNEVLLRQSCRAGYAGPLMQAPRVWLQGGQEAALLLPYKHEDLLVLVMLQESIQLTQDVVHALLDVLQSKCTTLLEAIKQQPGGSAAWQLPGGTYLFLDHLCQAYRASSRAPTASPTTPLTTMTDALLFQPQAASAASADGGDSEAIWRLPAEGMWAVVRRSGQRELRVILEQPRTGGSLAAVGDVVQKFCDGALPGVFEM